MKKNLLMAVVMVLLATPASAQEIIVDKTNQDGSRMIATDEEFVLKNFMDKNPIGYSLGYIDVENIGAYYIDLTIQSLVNFALPEGGLLLLKTTSGDVIEGKQTLSDYQTEDLLGSRSGGITLHRIRGSYAVKLKDLEKIASEGITKVRIERKASVIDVEYKEKKILQTKEIFSSRLKILKDAINKESNIRDGF